MICRIVKRTPRRRPAGIRSAAVHAAWAFLLILCIASPMAAQQTAPSVAFRRAHHLQHGVNTAIWFAQSSSNYTVERLRTFTTEQDLDLIASLGFDHIRLSIDPVPLTAWSRGQADGVAFVGELDRVVQAALKDHLAVILDVHPEAPYKQRLLQGDSSVADFANLWRALATHYKGTDPQAVFFEIMNEPEQTDRFRWIGIEATVAAVIRQVDTDHTLIAAGAHWSGLVDLLQTETLADPNVIYTFHDYEPFPFTHQGATWTGDELKPLRHVPYPSDPAGVAANIAQEPDLAAQLYVENYGLDHWDAEHLDRMIAYAQKWGEAKHVPVYCGEFGADREFVDPDARNRWIHDMRTALEHHGIGWAMWDYRTNFGLVTKTGSETHVDEGVVRALGVHRAGQ